MVSKRRRRWPPPQQQRQELKCREQARALQFCSQRPCSLPRQRLRGDAKRALCAVPDHRRDLAHLQPSERLTGKRPVLSKLETQRKALKVKRFCTGMKVKLSPLA